MRGGKHEHKGHHRGEHREGHNPKHEDKKHFRSAQTFRRGRALAFLERLHVKRDTLMQQLDQPEYESIKQVISGELKATDTIIQEFVHMFELLEMDSPELSTEEPSVEEQQSTEQSINNNEDEENIVNENS